jgi:hypothetical protein
VESVVEATGLLGVGDSEQSGAGEAVEERGHAAGRPKHRQDDTCTRALADWKDSSTSVDTAAGWHRGLNLKGAVHQEKT